MRKVGLYSFVLLSTLYATANNHRVFTQNTQLDQSYSSIISTPSKGEVLIWGEIDGGSKDNPIILSTKGALNIDPIHNQGDTAGILLDSRSHTKLVGEFNFQSISSTIPANDTGIAVGIMSVWGGSILNEANLTFKEIKNNIDGAVGVYAFSVLQKGTLRFERIQAKSILGIITSKLDNQANASIIFDDLEATYNAYALNVLLAKNSGKIIFGNLQGHSAMAISSLFLLNEGEIGLKNIQGQSDAVGASVYCLANMGIIKLDSITSQGKSRGIGGNLLNAGEISLGYIFAQDKAVGLEVDDMWNSKSITLHTIQANNTAIGIDATSFSNDQGGQLVFDLIKGENLALGMKIRSSSFNGGVMSFKSITSSQRAIGIQGEFFASKGSSTTFEKIQAPTAIGIYEDTFFSGIGGGGNVVFENITGNESYGILIEKGGNLESSSGVDHSIIHFKNIQSNVGIKNLGEMQIFQDSFVFAPIAPAQNNSAIYSDMTNGQFYLNSIGIDTPYDYAFFAKQDAKVYIQSSQASINAGKYSFGGESHLVLSNQAELTLQSGGTLKSLNASDSKLMVNNNGYSKKLVINDFQAQNNTFTLSVDFDRNQTSSYDGGAVYENGAKSTKGISSFLLIDSSKSTSKLENILSINLDSKSNVGKKYVLLAQVVGANKDNIVFNSLSSGQTTSITTSGRYTTNELLLGRYDDGSSNYYYLVADTFQAQDNLPSKPIKPPKPNPTPPQSVEKKEGHNALTYNPVESIMLSTLDWSQARFSKLRDDDRIGRVWAEFGAEYWKFDAKNSDESFVDLAFGGDYLFSFAKGKNALGIAVEVTGSFIEHTQFLGAKSYPFKIDSKILGLALYDVLLLDGGIYSNMSAKVGGGSSGFGDVNVFAQNIEDENLLYFSFSEQVGKRWFFSPSASGMFVDFSATVAVGYAEGMSIYSEVDSMPWDGADFLSIATKPSFINQNKLEILLGYQSALNSFFSLDVNAGVGTVTNHRIDGSMQYENKNGVYDFDGVSYVGGLEVMANVVARFGNWIDAYVNIGSTWSKDYHEVVDFSTGVKLRFGTV